MRCPLALAGAFGAAAATAVPGKPLALLLWLPLLWPDRALPAHGETEIVVIDVGQGLSVLVRTRTHALLYDMGPAILDGYDAGERAVVPALHALGVRRLDAMVVSHGDSDHAGGLDAVKRRFPAAAAYAPEGAGIDDTAPCVSGATWHRDGVRLRFLHQTPHFPYLGNEASCVLRIETAHGSALLTGDIGEVLERSLVRREPDALRADVVVVPHHGSTHSSDADFVAATGARLALVSAGHGNRFRHPHPSVAASLARADAEVCRRRKPARCASAYRPMASSYRRNAPRIHGCGTQHAGSKGWPLPRLGYPLARIEAAFGAGGKYVLELVKAGGWPMIPLLLLSALALAIIIERFWTLRRNAVLPPGLGREVREWAARGRLDPVHVNSLRGNSPLGALLAAALDVRSRPREEIRERVEDVGRHIAFRLERFLNALGTIAAQVRCSGCSAPWSA